jgi:hypothetical protein
MCLACCRSSSILSLSESRSILPWQSDLSSAKDSWNSNDLVYARQFTPAVVGLDCLQSRRQASFDAIFKAVLCTWIQPGRRVRIQKKTKIVSTKQQKWKISFFGEQDLLTGGGGGGWGAVGFASSLYVLLRVC